MYVVTKRVLTAMTSAMRQHLLQSGHEVQHQRCLDAVASSLCLGGPHEAIATLRAAPVLLAHGDCLTPYSTGQASTEAASCGATQLLRLAACTPWFDLPAPGSDAALLAACLALHPEPWAARWAVLGVEEGRIQLGPTFGPALPYTQLLPLQGLKADARAIPEQTMTEAARAMLPVLRGTSDEGGREPGASDLVARAGMSGPRWRILLERHSPVGAAAVAMLRDALSGLPVRVLGGNGEWLDVEVGKLGSFPSSRHAALEEAVAAWRDNPGRRVDFYSTLIAFVLNTVWLPDALQAMADKNSRFSTFGQGDPVLVALRDRVMQGLPLSEAAEGLLPWPEMLLMPDIETWSEEFAECLKCCRETALLCNGGGTGPFLRSTMLWLAAALYKQGFTLSEVFRRLQNRDWSLFGDSDGYVDSIVRHVFTRIERGEQLGTACMDVLQPEERACFESLELLPDFPVLFLQAARKMLSEFCRK